jgi:hypothetical protein
MIVILAFGAIRLLTTSPAVRQRVQQPSPPSDDLAARLSAAQVNGSASSAAKVG